MRNYLCYTLAPLLIYLSICALAAYGIATRI